MMGRMNCNAMEVDRYGQVHRCITDHEHTGWHEDAGGFLFNADARLVPSRTPIKVYHHTGDPLPPSLESAVRPIDEDRVFAEGTVVLSIGGHFAVLAPDSYLITYDNGQIEALSSREFHRQWRMRDRSRSHVPKRVR